MKHAFVAVALLLTAAARPAAAELLEPSPPAAPQGSVTPVSDWRAVAYLGGYGTSDDSEGGATLGMSFQARYGPLVGGGLMEFAGGLSGSCTGLAVAMGVGARPWQRLRLELLGTFGVHLYESVGRDWLFGDDPGASGRSGYGGARGVVGYIFGRRAYHFEMGVYADYQNDFSRERQIYEYPATGTGWFEGGGTGDHVVGASRLGFGLELGAAHDIL